MPEKKDSEEYASASREDAVAGGDLRGGVLDLTARALPSLEKRLAKLEMWVE